MTQPVLAVTDPDGSRYYVHPLTGEKVPSVTTVIKQGVPKQALVNWAARMAAEHAVKNWLRLSTMPAMARVDEIKNAHIVYTEQKADIGDIVHSLVECWSTGQPFPSYPKEVNGFVNQLIDFMTAKRPRFLENECTFWSRKYGYAGTGDFIIDVNGRVLLSDLKSGKSLWPEVGLQTSALANADFILRPDGTEDPIPHIDGIAALHVRPRSWKLVELNKADECFQGFLAAKGVADWERLVASNVL
jgi:hypothetical protein